MDSHTIDLLIILTNFLLIIATMIDALKDWSTAKRLIAVIATLAKTRSRDAAREAAKDGRHEG